MAADSLLQDAPRKVRVVFTGTWEGIPDQFFDDGAWLIDGAKRLHDSATDAELAEQMRSYGSLARVLVDWNLLDSIEVYVGSEKVW